MEYQLCHSEHEGLIKLDIVTFKTHARIEHLQDVMLNSSIIERKHTKLLYI